MTRKSVVATTTAALSEYQRPRVSILAGDCREMLRSLPSESVHCVVTSPPYWGLRDYGVPGQLGQEPTVQAHIEAIVEVFREVHRVLRSDGTLWFNYGDCYHSGKGESCGIDPKQPARRFGKRPQDGPQPGLKPKDLCMLPNRLAIALQDDGWWVRSETVWGKPNAMPESVNDRPASAHEKIFLLTKSRRYFYDPEAVRQGRRTPGDDGKVPSGWDTGPGPHGRYHRSGRANPARGRDKKQRGHGRRHAGFNARWDAMSREEQQANGRHLRNYEPAPLTVWEMATASFKEAHFATFPPELAKRCILAGCPPQGVVLDPFAGSGTTGLVADRLGRSAILIELNPVYAEMAHCRIEGEAGLFSSIVASADPRETAER